VGVASHGQGFPGEDGDIQIEALCPDQTDIDGNGITLF